jgi:hypothetical protein
MERGTSQELNDFLWQIEGFQGSCQQNSEKGHRVIITGRLLALQGIEGKIPPNMERVELLPMDDELQQQWFTKWETQVGGIKLQHFSSFCKINAVPIGCENWQENRYCFICWRRCTGMAN